ncbi:cupin domain-containing protein [Ornithinicoccus halotolerans]|uniref:cupin domain-containing protein n=1 Tax=Ornithinicoccus halotolerans TaxID=1748220 RepID=UPI00188646CB|nr:cupin domain-containing protein [Ornithinicoccus halotolerans]
MDLMRSRRAVAALGAAGLAATTIAGATLTGTAVADEHEPPFTAELVARGALSSPERTVITAKIHLQPGGYVDWHRHPGKTTGIVTGGGAFTILDRGCGAHRYASGEAFHPPRQTHTARNFSDAPVTLVLTYEVRGEAPTIFASPEVDDTLDAACGLEE